MSKRSRIIVYYPPPDELIEEYARQVCKQMEEIYQVPEYAAPETIWGLTAFLKVVTKIVTHQLNQSKAKTDEKLDNE
jgi:hypothetical protein